MIFDIFHSYVSGMLLASLGYLKCSKYFYNEKLRIEIWNTLKFDSDLLYVLRTGMSWSKSFSTVTALIDYGKSFWS